MKNKQPGFDALAKIRAELEAVPDPVTNKPDRLPGVDRDWFKGHGPELARNFGLFALDKVRRQT